MNPSTTAATIAAAALPLPGLDSPQLGGLALTLLALSALFATLRAGLLRVSPARILACAQSDSKRERLEQLMRRSAPLSTSANVLKLTCDLSFTGCVFLLLSEPKDAGQDVILALLLSVPLILLATELLPSIFVRAAGPGILAKSLPFFDVVQLPIAALTWLLLRIQSTLLGLMGQEQDARQRLMDDLREVVEDGKLEGDLHESERELIENVMEFRDVDVAEIMTPRTELSAVEVDSGIQAAIETVARDGHSRIPVYRGTPDTIVGIFVARDVINMMAENGFQEVRLEEVLRPAFFVPETKLVSELLSEFRRDRLKVAIVLDEYGGTAGLVSMGDILGELVGDIPDEFDLEEPEPIHHVHAGKADVDASLRVSEVNEELELGLPEDADYETLAGFVLSKLGHFPKSGESFQDGDIEYTVLEANDRRVIKMRVERLSAESTA